MSNSSLTERIRGVLYMTKIYTMLGLSAQILVEKKKHVKKHKFGNIEHFRHTILLFLYQNLRRKPYHDIYFLFVLLESFRLSYRTLKSDNFEKLTYNANMFFQFAKKAQKSDTKF